MKHTMKRQLWGLLVPLLILVAWWIYSASGSNLYFPPVPEVFETLRTSLLGDGFTRHVLPSLRNWFLGFLVGCLAAIVFGLLIGSSRALTHLTRVPVEFARALPPPALIPVAIALLGIGEQMKWGVIAFGVFFPVLLATIDGVKGVEGTLLDTARLYRIRGRWHVTRVILPAAAPQIVAGMKVSLSIALILMIVSEMVASVQGLGFFTLQAQRTFSYSEMWAGIILLGLIGFLANMIFEQLSRRTLYWVSQ